MSKFVRVATELRDVALVKLVLDELKIQYSEEAEYHHGWSKTRRPVRILVRHGAAHFGLCETAGGPLELVGDDMAMRRVRQLLEQVQQRYAYHRVLAEVSRAGFDLVEEQTGADRVIRLTVRRWS